MHLPQKISSLILEICLNKIIQQYFTKNGFKQLFESVFCMHYSCFFVLITMYYEAAK